MVKNVYELLGEIYKGSINKLPERIKVKGRIYKKDNDWQNYFSDDNEEECLTKSEGDRINLLLRYKVEEVGEKDEKRWKPKCSETYYYVSDYGEICCDCWDDYNISDIYRYDTNNCTKTEKESEQHKVNINTEIELKKLAEKLNNGKKIDWKNNSQVKWFLTYDFEDKKIIQGYSYTSKDAREIFCLDKDFREIAIKQIGEEKIINYLKENL